MKKRACFVHTTLLRQMAGWQEPTHEEAYQFEGQEPELVPSEHPKVDEIDGEL